jgi:hypothetical protein
MCARVYERTQHTAHLAVDEVERLLKLNAPLQLSSTYLILEHSHSQTFTGLIQT